MCVRSHHRDASFTDFAKYNIASKHFTFDGDNLRKLPDPVPCRDEMIPDPDSIPLSILNYPPGKRREINFAVYDPPEVPLLPMGESHPMLVLRPDFFTQDVDRRIGSGCTTGSCTCTEDLLLP